ncbi:hypothetical protein CF131_20820 [Aeromonas dhakensis]|nr:hypothetical protein CF131_20820 [Aeromonas dhakensis]TNI40154.1 hypothetical protein CF130_20490 [Aeromonas dhakensis]
MGVARGHSGVRVSLCHEKGAFMHMNINATLMGQFILLLMIIVGVLAYWLARRRSERPALIATLCALLSLFPPLGLLALLLLVLHLDRSSGL